MTYHLLLFFSFGYRIVLGAVDLEEPQDKDGLELSMCAEYACKLLQFWIWWPYVIHFCSLAQERECHRGCVPVPKYLKNPCLQGGLVPWNLQTANSDPKNLLWEKDKTFICCTTPGPMCTSVNDRVCTCVIVCAQSIIGDSTRMFMPLCVCPRVCAK